MQVKQLSSEAATNRLEIAGLQQEVTKERSQSAKLKKQLADADGGLTALKGQLTDKEAALKAHKLKLSEAQGEMANVKSQLAVAADGLSAVKAQLAESNTDRAKAKDLLKEWQSEGAKIRAQLSAAEQEITQNKALMHDLDASLKGTQAKVAELQATCADKDKAHALLQVTMIFAAHCQKACMKTSIMYIKWHNYCEQTYGTVFCCANGSKVRCIVLYVTGERRAPHARGTEAADPAGARSGSCSRGGGPPRGAGGGQ